MKLDIYNLSIIFGIIITVYLILKFFGVFVDNIYYQEGMSNKSSVSNLSEIVSDITNLNSQMKRQIEQNSNSLLINKYKSDYEDFLINANDLLNQTIFSNLLSLMDEDNGSLSSQSTMDSISILNSLYTLKDNLNSSMLFIDKQTSSLF